MGRKFFGTDGVRGRVGELPITPERLATALTATARHMRPFAADPSGLEVLGLPRQTGAQLALQLTPIATPIIPKKRVSTTSPNTIPRLYQIGASANTSVRLYVCSTPPTMADIPKKSGDTKSTRVS